METKYLQELRLLDHEPTKKSDSRKVAFVFYVCFIFSSRCPWRAAGQSQRQNRRLLMSNDTSRLRPESRGSIQPWAADGLQFKARPWFEEDWIKRQYL